MKSNYTSASDRRWQERYRRIQRRKETEANCKEFLEPTAEELSAAYDLIILESKSDSSILLMSYDELINQYVKRVRQARRESRDYLRWDTSQLASFLSDFSQAGGE